MRTRRLEPFVYSSTIAYLLEFGDRYIRVYYDDELITAIESPYLESELPEFQYRQIADVMRIVHPKHPPIKLSRTQPTVFTLEEIDFRKGPFLTRNDLVDPTNLTPTEMRCTALSVGETGVLLTTGDVFQEGHEGALFKLIHPKATTTTNGSYSGTTTGVICAAITIKGTGSFNTHGSWSGTIVLQRNENNSDWENFRTYISGDPPDRNVQLSWTEKEDNVQYRANVTAHTSGTIGADLSGESTLGEGIVRVSTVSGPRSAICEVIKDLESTEYTKRWAEGAWSTFRGFPATIEFFEDRCVYAGGISNSDRTEVSIPAYPVLQGQP